MTSPPSRHPQAGLIHPSAAEQTETTQQAAQAASRLESSAFATETLYATRDAMRSVLGDRYREKIAEFTPILQAMMRHEKCDALLALTEVLTIAQHDPIATSQPDNGMFQALMIACAVELIEEDGKADV